MPVEGIQQLYFEVEAYIFLDREVLDNADVFVKVLEVANLTCHAGHISKEKSAIVAGWARTGLSRPEPTIVGHVLINQCRI
jgi:hypothetical protein